MKGGRRAGDGRRIKRPLFSVIDCLRQIIIIPYDKLQVYNLGRRRLCLDLNELAAEVVERVRNDVALIVGVNLGETTVGLQ